MTRNRLSTNNKNNQKSVSFLVAVFASWLCFGWLPTLTYACKCVPPVFETNLENAKHVDIVYILGQVHMNNGHMVGWVDEDEEVEDVNAPIYYKAFRFQSIKGPGSCRSWRRRTPYVYFQTAGSSAACGVRLERDTWYLLGSSSEDVVRPLNSCGSVVQPWRDYTCQQRAYVARTYGRTQCPPRRGRGRYRHPPQGGSHPYCPKI
ncbi:hypothetical protein ACA910_009548 [Epithemia clementina (nom. ined.)]